MSHEIGYKIYPCKTTPKQILKDLNSWAYDPHETCCYHGNITFHNNTVCKDRQQAEEFIEAKDDGWYSDHAVYFKDGRRKNWLVKYEYHC